MAEVIKVASVRDNDIHIHNAVVIPKGASNGDMIKAIFPYAFKGNYVESSEDMHDYVTIYLGDYEMRVSYDWWYAPYKKEVAE